MSSESLTGESNHVSRVATVDDLKPGRMYRLHKFGRSYDKGVPREVSSQEFYIEKPIDKTSKNLLGTGRLRIYTPSGQVGLPSTLSFYDLGRNIVDDLVRQTAPDNSKSSKKNRVYLGYSEHNFIEYLGERENGK